MATKGEITPEEEALNTKILDYQALPEGQKLAQAAKDAGYSPDASGEYPAFKNLMNTFGMTLEELGQYDLADTKSGAYGTNPFQRALNVRFGAPGMGVGKLSGKPSTTGPSSLPGHKSMLSGATSYEDYSKRMGEANKVRAAKGLEVTDPLSKRDYMGPSAEGTDPYSMYARSVGLDPNLTEAERGEMSQKTPGQSLPPMVQSSQLRGGGWGL